MDDWPLTELAQQLGLQITAEQVQPVVLEVPAERWLEVFRIARDQAGLTFFDWLSAVDEPDADIAAVDVLAHLVRPIPHPGASGLTKVLLRTRIPVEPGPPCLPSLTGLWASAAWHERETHEMFGVEFHGFTDGTAGGLRPLLLPDGFEGTPLRKSFHLAARASKPWPGAKEPGEGGGGSPSRRKMLPPGVPPTNWGPRNE